MTRLVVSCAGKSILKDIVLPAIVEFLSGRGLQLQPEKTKITHINSGFDFLGQNVRKYNKKLLIKPSKKSVTNIKRKASEVIKKSGNIPAYALIFLLNPILRGWANYHRHIVSKKVLSRIDNDIYHMLWRWAKRRPNTKGCYWISNKYYKSIGSRNWVFAAPDKGALVELFKMESIPIKRYIMLKHGANLYDKDWYAYFDARSKSSRVRT